MRKAQGSKNKDKQNNACHQKRNRHLFPKCVRDEKNREKAGDAEKQALDYLMLQIIESIVEFYFALVGRSAGEHRQSENDQNYQAGQKD
jgi:hypothetical protein